MLCDRAMLSNMRAWPRTEESRPEGSSPPLFACVSAEEFLAEIAADTIQNCVFGRADIIAYRAAPRFG
jgi:hypothetical protein